MVRKTVSTEVRGGVYGTSFDDRPSIKDLETIVIQRIVITHSAQVNSLTVSITILKDGDKNTINSIGLLLRFQRRGTAQRQYRPRLVDGDLATAR